MSLVYFMLGGLTVAWFFTVAAVAYAVWKYVFLPWQVMRRDVQAVVALVNDQNAKIAALADQVKISHVMNLDDAELARRETKARQRAAMSGV